MTESIGTEPQRLQLQLGQIIGGEIAWSQFRPGIEIFRLHGDATSGSSSALLRYMPGARLPQHMHSGHEHVIVISGSQSDERGVYGPGTLIVNVPGSKHCVASDEGCVVLVIWEAPVIFDDVATSTHA